jgi:uncharacterized protein (TIGR00266 family)
VPRVFLGSDGGGVSCFDGTSFRNFTTQEGPNDDRVFGVLEDKTGNLCLSTLGAGACRHDGSSFAACGEDRGLTRRHEQSMLEASNGCCGQVVPAACSAATGRSSSTCPGTDPGGDGRIHRQQHRSCGAHGHFLPDARSPTIAAMKITLEHGPAFAWARVQLNAGESIKAEAGAMVSMSTTVEIKTTMQGGLLGALARKVLSSESFFQNTFTATRSAGEITLAPSLMGDIHVRELRGDELLLTSGAYLASDPAVTLQTKWGGMKSFFAKEGLFLLRAQGTGSLLFTCYGALVEVTVPADGCVVDTGHVVAFEPSLDYSVQKVGGIKSTLLSGEGLVCRFSGSGRLWIQTRSLDAFVGTLVPFLPTRSSN